MSQLRPFNDNMSERAKDETIHTPLKFNSLIYDIQISKLCFRPLICLHFCPFDHHIIIPQIWYR